MLKGHFKKKTEKNKQKEPTCAVQNFNQKKKMEVGERGR